VDETSGSLARASYAASGGEYDPKRFKGDVFIFRPKRTDRVKILVYDGTGLVLYSKRLEAGRFSWSSPAESVVRLSAAQLAALLEGLPWHHLRARAIPRPSTAW
jgi:transposase